MITIHSDDCLFLWRRSSLLQQVVYSKGDIVKTKKLTHSNSLGASFQKQQAESDPRVDFGATLGYCKQDTTALL